MWQFGKHENPEHWRVDRLTLVAQPTLEQLEHAKRIRRARAQANREAARETVERREREQLRETVRQNQENNKRKRREKFERIEEYLRTCEQGMTVEQIAEALDVSCKEVRQVVSRAKRWGWLVEDAMRTHALIRGKFKVTT